MSSLLIDLPVRLSEVEIDKLQAELAPLAKISEPPAQQFSFGGMALIVEFGANALQVVDILASWLRRTPRGNQATIRLADGRTLKMDANTDPDDFVKQLKAALKNM